MPRILAFAGSTRRASLNKRLVTAAAAHARSLGADVTQIDLSDHPLPIYDGDLEEQHGVPDGAVALQRLMLDHDAFLLACPEYNGSITPLLKNVIDWTSRPSDAAGVVEVTRDKVIGLVSASPGALGGMRGLVHVRAILTGIGAHVVPGDASVPKAHEVLGEDGTIGDEGAQSRVHALVRRLVETTDALR